MITGVCDGDRCLLPHARRGTGGALRSTVARSDPDRRALEDTVARSKTSRSTCYRGAAAVSPPIAHPAPASAQRSQHRPRPSTATAGGRLTPRASNADTGRHAHRPVRLSARAARRRLVERGARARADRHRCEACSRVSGLRACEQPVRKTHGPAFAGDINCFFAALPRDGGTDTAYPNSHAPRRVFAECREPFERLLARITSSPCTRSTAPHTGRPAKTPSRPRVSRGARSQGEVRYQKRSGGANRWAPVCGAPLATSASRSSQAFRRTHRPPTVESHGSARSASTRFASAV